MFRWSLDFTVTTNELRRWTTLDQDFKVLFADFGVEDGLEIFLTASTRATNEARK